MAFFICICLVCLLLVGTSRASTPMLPTNTLVPKLEVGKQIEVNGPQQGKLKVDTPPNALSKVGEQRAAETKANVPLKEAIAPQKATQLQLSHKSNSVPNIEQSKTAASVSEAKNSQPSLPQSNSTASGSSSGAQLSSQPQPNAAFSRSETGGVPPSNTMSKTTGSVSVPKIVPHPSNESKTEISNSSSFLALSKTAPSVSKMGVVPSSVTLPKSAVFGSGVVPPSLTQSSGSDSATGTAPPSIEIAPPSIERAPPSIERAPPSIERAPPSIERAPPSIERAPPSIERAPPSIERAPPSASMVGVGPPVLPLSKRASSKDVQQTGPDSMPVTTQSLQPKSLAHSKSAPIQKSQSKPGVPLEAGARGGLLHSSTAAQPDGGGPHSLDPETEPYYCRNSLHGAINDFILKLERLLNHEENFFISPLSISMSLTMAYFAAGGRTASQMDSVLEYVNHGLSVQDIEGGFRRILASLQEDEAEGHLLQGCGMFLQKGFPVDALYVSRIQDIFGAVVQYMNFAGDGEAAVRDIDSWVSDKTRTRIPRFFYLPLDARTRMMLLSAAHFQGTWETPFPRSKSTLADFHQPDGNVKIVGMMVLPRVNAMFLEDELTEFKFVELPYTGHTAMLLALPFMIDAPADLEMTSELLCEINSRMVLTELRDVTIPRFRIESELPLRPLLESLGMTDLFRNCAANLSRIREEGDLHLDKIHHRAIVNVEEGEGSDASDLLYLPTADEMLEESEYPVTFVANHPFLFYVIDKRNGLVLLSGRLSDPVHPDTVLPPEFYAAGMAG